MTEPGPRCANLVAALPPEEVKSALLSAIAEANGRRIDGHYLRAYLANAVLSGSHAEF